MIDFDKPSAGWTRLAQPFRRRALAIAGQGTQLFFIGGMNSDNQPTLDVDILDTASGKWSKGPELPAGKHKGFSCSAIAHAGRVYANSFQGDLLRLATDARSWEAVARVQHPRLAHRLVTTDTAQLIVLGGEDGDEKRPELEWLTPAATPRPPQRAASNIAEPSTTSAR